MATHEIIWTIDVAKILITLVLIGMLFIGYRQYDITKQITKLDTDINKMTEEINIRIPYIPETKEFNCQDLKNMTINDVGNAI